MKKNQCFRKNIITSKFSQKRATQTGAGRLLTGPVLPPPLKLRPYSRLIIIITRVTVKHSGELRVCHITTLGKPFTYMLDICYNAAYMSQTHSGGSRGSLGSDEHPSGRIRVWWLKTLELVVSEYSSLRDILLRLYSVHNLIWQHEHIEG